MSKIGNMEWEEVEVDYTIPIPHDYIAIHVNWPWVQEVRKHHPEWFRVVWSTNEDILSIALSIYRAAAIYHKLQHNYAGMTLCEFIERFID
jgi:hypothetical protein